MRILLVEDQAALNLLMVEVLQNDGHSVLGALNAETALEAVEDDAFDLMLTDLKLPGIDGLALAERVRRLIPGIAILFVSGLITATDRSAAEKFGTVLHKPISPQELIDQVKTVTKPHITSSEVR